MATSKALKFPIITNLEYLDLIKNKQTLVSLTQKDLKPNSTWRELQLYLGKKFPSGVYTYQLKMVNDNTLHRGQIRVFTTSGSEQPVLKNISDNSMLNEINQLKEKINSISQSSGGGVSVDLLLSITKQSYETQINFLNNELQRKENLISKYENEIEKLNDDLDNAYDQIDDLKSKTGINQYLELATTFLNGKIGNSKKIETLKDSDPADIPKRILDILGAVNWNEVPPDVIQQIINYLEVFITKLPLKGS